MCPSAHILQQPKSTSLTGQTMLHTGVTSFYVVNVSRTKIVRSTFYVTVAHVPFVSCFVCLFTLCFLA